MNKISNLVVMISEDTDWKWPKFGLGMGQCMKSTTLFGVKFKKWNEANKVAGARDRLEKILKTKFQKKQTLPNQFLLPVKPREGGSEN